VSLPRGAEARGTVYSLTARRFTYRRLIYRRFTYRRFISRQPYSLPTKALDKPAYRSMTSSIREPYRGYIGPTQ
jgi:hypothetical protein